jgi:peptidoglycan/LPS O-acetylase OafA/YrhL
MVFFHVSTFPKEGRAILTGSFTGWIGRGDLGVDLFFTLSGFLMGSILFREYQKAGEIRFARFYARRFLRLIPVYGAVMLLGLYMLRNQHTSLMHPTPSGNAEYLWANLLYVNNSFENLHFK